MHFLAILAGAIAGAWVGGVSDNFLGMILGVIVMSLLYRLNKAKANIAALLRRVEILERKDAAIRVDREAAAEPPKTAAKAASVPKRVSIYEPESESPPVPAPKVTVQTPVPESTKAGAPRQTSTIEHLADVAGRWITTGNVPVKVGIIISFFGVSFLLKYAIENSIVNIPISVRYIGIAIFAAVLMGLGWRMRVSNKVYALSLQGGGIGILFLVVFAAFRLHGLLSPTVGFALLVLLTAAAGLLAVRQESRALAILGTTGGFLAPLLVSTGSGNHIALFTYYLILNCAVLGVAWVRAWRELNIIGFVFTFGVGTLWGAQYYVPELAASTIPFLALYFLFYTAIAVLFAMRSRPALRGIVDGTLVFGTPTIAFALQTRILDHTEYGLAISAAIVAVFYAVLAIWLHRCGDDRFSLLRQSFIALGVVFGTVAIPLALDDRWTAIAWALEGSALVWIGVRQSTSLAKASGVVLAIGSGIGFFNYGWTDDPGWPVLNGNFMGAALIALTSIYSAWLLLDNARKRAWQEFSSVALLVWGLGWWFSAGGLEIVDWLADDYVLHAMLLFGAASFSVLAYAGRRFDWLDCRRIVLGWLPVLAIAAILYLGEYDHFLDGFGVLAWLAALAVHLWILRTGEGSRHISLWHGGGAVFWLAIASYEAFWQVDRAAINEVWAFTAAMVVFGGGAFLILLQRERRSWPFTGHFEAYFLAAVVMVALYAFFVFVASFGDPGNPMPLPYIPVLNPFDLLSVGVLALLWYTRHAAGNRGNGGYLGINRDNRLLVLAWAGAAFLLVTLALMRAVHHLADVPWDSDVMMASTTMQTSLTIFWAALGLAGMLFGTRRANRRVWMIGVGLMAVVVLKLMVVDLSNTGTVARIVSFLGVGVMLLVVGYFSPVPPRRKHSVGEIDA